MNRIQRRRRSIRHSIRHGRTDLDAGFGLTMSDVMADLDAGWLTRHGGHEA